MPRPCLLIANWKMTKIRSEAQAFCKELASLLPKQNLPQLAICPSFTLLETVSAAIQQHVLPVALGAQNMAEAQEGAYTGEVSYPQLLDLGVSLVLLGHSERRELFGESNAAVNEKAKQALAQGLTPIICVGESLDQRQAGETDSWVKSQVEAAISGLSSHDLSKIVLAYEPIWAIGTGEVCAAEEAGRVCGLIRQWVGCEETRVLYGGSVKPDNMASIMAQSSIDGGLVGGASLKADSFAQLVQLTHKETALCTSN